MAKKTIPTTDQILRGALFDEPMRIVTVEQGGNNIWVLGLASMQTERFRRGTLDDTDLATLGITEPGFSCKGDGRLLRLGLQAYSLGIASKSRNGDDCHASGYGTRKKYGSAGI